MEEGFAQAWERFGILVIPMGVLLAVLLVWELIKIGLSLVFRRRR